MKNRKTKRQLNFLNKKDWRKKGEDLQKREILFHGSESDYLQGAPANKI